MIYAPDLVEGIIAAAQHPDTRGKTYFLANPENYTVLEVFKTIGKAVGKPFGITLPVPIFVFRSAALLTEWRSRFSRQKPIPTRDKVRDLSQVNWLCSAKKAKDDFGWQAKTSLLDGAKTTNDHYLAEAEKLEQMPDESKGTLRIWYFSLSLGIGILIELLAAFGKVYFFNYWWLTVGVIVVFWGFIFGWLAMLTRKSKPLIQYLPGFILLLGCELLNHYYLHGWTFPNNSLYGITNPVVRAFILGIGAGFLIPLINTLVKQLYQRKLRLG